MKSMCLNKKFVMPFRIFFHRFLTILFPKYEISHHIKLYKYQSGMASGIITNQKDRFPNLKVIILAFTFLFRSIYISAQTDLPDSVVSVRLQTIETMLNQGKPNANLWWYGWLAGYSAATVGQGAVAISTNDAGLRQDMALGAATTFLGAVGQLITPMVPGYAPDRLSKISGYTKEDRRQKLIDAEALLKESALREKSGRSWQTHAVAGVVNLSSGLITWFGFKRDIWAGLENFALNTCITEAQIWTQPTKAMKDYKNYCKLYKSGESTIALKPETVWLVSGSPGGVQLKIVF
jgi:hypothetical protein